MTIDESPHTRLVTFAKENFAALATRSAPEGLSWLESASVRVDAVKDGVTLCVFVRDGQRLLCVGAKRRPLTGEIFIDVPSSTEEVRPGLLRVKDDIGEPLCVEFEDEESEGE